MEPADWKDVGAKLHFSVANGGRLALTNVTPGTYDFARQKSVRVGTNVPYGQPVWIDRRTIVLDSGQTQNVDLVRAKGSSLRGELVGLEETDAPGAYIYVRSGTASGDPKDLGERALPSFDALAFNRGDRQFQTARLEPGTYTVVAEAYRPETREQQGRSGIRLPAWIGTAKVTISANTPPAPVRIEMRPR
jgi:hypothetical protein